MLTVKDIQTCATTIPGSKCAVSGHFGTKRVLVKIGSAEVRDAGVLTGKKRETNCERKVRDNG